MVLVKLRSSLEDNQHFIEEVKENVTQAELAAIAKSRFDCFTNSSKNPVKIYLPSGAEFKEGTLQDNQELYASQLRKDNESNMENPLKLCILGPGGVGKSCILLRLTRNIFADYLDSTIEDSHRHVITVDGQIVTLDVLDTAGQEEFDGLRAAWYRKKDGFLLVFALDNPAGLGGLEKFYHEVSNFYEAGGSDSPPILVAANKSDKVTAAESEDLWLKAEKYSKEWKAIDLMRTSAKTGLNIEATFANLVRAIRRRNNTTVKKKKWICDLL